MKPAAPSSISGGRRTTGAAAATGGPHGRGHYERRQRLLDAPPPVMEHVYSLHQPSQLLEAATVRRRARAAAPSARPHRAHGTRDPRRRVGKAHALLSRSPRCVLRRRSSHASPARRCRSTRRTRASPSCCAPRPRRRRSSRRRRMAPPPLAAHPRRGALHATAQAKFAAKVKYKEAQTPSVVAIKTQGREEQGQRLLGAKETDAERQGPAPAPPRHAREARSSRAAAGEHQQGRGDQDALAVGDDRRRLEVRALPRSSPNKIITQIAARPAEAHVEDHHHDEPEHQPLHRQRLVAVRL